MTATKPRIYTGDSSPVDDYFNPPAPSGFQTLKELNTENWARFDKTKPRHKVILSLCRQAQWTTPNDRHGEVADLERLSNFLKSEKSPVRKPLMLMTCIEVEKIIMALSGIVRSIYK